MGKQYCDCNKMIWPKMEKVSCVPTLYGMGHSQTCGFCFIKWAHKMVFAKHEFIHFNCRQQHVSTCHFCCFANTDMVVSRM